MNHLKEKYNGLEVEMDGLKDQLSLAKTEANKLQEQNGALKMELKTAKEESRDSLHNQKVVHRVRINQAT